MADEIRVNGMQLSWGSIIAKVDGERYTGFTAISYGDKVETAKTYGMGRHHSPRGRTRGKYTTEPVKLTGPKSSMQALREQLAKRSSDGKTYGTVPFELVVQFVDTGEKGITVALEECRLVGNTEGHEENPDPLTDEVEIDCMRIRRNGLTLFEEAQ